jgi:4-amino-4-deoxy-L-arabinose transferase-like glycosyltransferase
MGKFGFEFLYQSGNDPDLLLALGRLPTLFWGLLLLLSTFAVARTLFGDRGGMVALGLATFCPALLAHSHFVTQDVPVAALFFLTVVAYWNLEKNRTSKWAIYCGALLGGAITTKFSAVFLLPILATMGLAYGLRETARLRSRTDSPPSSLSAVAAGWIRRGTDAILILGTCWMVIWAVYGFRFSGSPDPSYHFIWDFPLTGRSWIAGACRLASDSSIVPEALAYGFQWQNEHNERGHPGYALGDYTQTGWWWYFPLAFLVKTPLPALILYCWGAWACARKPSPGALTRELLFIPLIYYVGFSLASRIDLGIRYLLPVYPFLAVLSGAVASNEPGSEPSTRFLRLKTALMATTAAGCLLAAPYFLPYFNFPSNVLFYRHFLLVDSNLDWGQDLKRLKQWMDAQGIPEVKMAYFGFGSPRQLALSHQVLPADNPYSHLEPEWKPAASLEPGDYVALSATALVGVLSPDRTYYLRHFRQLRPLKIIGHSILIFQIPPGMHSRLN